ncbi:DNA (cytosine-5-)-methyltransferase [Kitasatospora arboriphila]
MGSDGAKLTSIEICAGAGGQAVGLHAAGFRHLALVEIDTHAVETLQWNIKDRPAKPDDPWGWEREHCLIHEGDVKDFRPLEKIPGLEPRKLDLLAGGVPCPPFSIAGKQLGQDDERDLFPRMLQLVEELQPRAVMIENVRGLLEPAHKFRSYRKQILQQLRNAGDDGYVVCGWEVLEAASFGVPQLRPRAILVAIRKDCWRRFTWPKESNIGGKTVFEVLDPSMRRRYGIRVKTAPGLDTPALRALAEQKYDEWRKKARAAVPGVAPTLVGGSKKHGGADLGPTRAKAAWKKDFGVDALGVANDEKTPDVGRDLLGPNGPMLTVKQAALIQGFPQNWEFKGRKTAGYRQVGNAFPPPVAEAVARAIAEALELPESETPDPEPQLDDDLYDSEPALELPLSLGDAAQLPSPRDCAEAGAHPGVVDLSPEPPSAAVAE